MGKWEDAHVRSLETANPAEVSDVNRRTSHGRSRVVNGLLSIVTQSRGNENSESRASTGLLRGGTRRRQWVPRQWLYATRPKFRRLNGSLVDCLRNVEEVRLLVDLGKFFPGEVCLDIRPDRYFVTATRDNLHFAEEIALPNDTDTSVKEEHFKDGILEFVLPKKTEVGGPAKTGKGDDG